MTLSFFARKGADFSSNVLKYIIFFGQGTDDNPVGMTSQTNSSSNATLATTFTKYTKTVTVPANTSQITVAFAFDPTGTAGSNDWFEIAECQLERGSVATSFEHRPHGQELALCKRYCQKFDGLKINARMNGSTNSDGYWQFPTMRATPSFSSDVSAGKSMEYGSIGRTVANVYGGGSSPESAYSRFNISGSGTSGHASYNNLATGSYYLLEAEI